MKSSNIHFSSHLHEGNLMDIYCESWQKPLFWRKTPSEKLRLMFFIEIVTLHFGNQTYSIKSLCNCFLHLFFEDGWYLVHLVILQSKGNFQESMAYTKDIPTVLTKLSNIWHYRKKIHFIIANDISSQYPWPSRAILLWLRVTLICITLLGKGIKENITNIFNLWNQIYSNTLGTTG